MYDSESGFYYLRSRYYNPYVGRWLNADIYISTGQDFDGNNMFAYCGNNPVIRVDHTGTRYCEGTSVQNENPYGRIYACQWQNAISIATAIVENNPSSIASLNAAYFLNRDDWVTKAPGYDPYGENGNEGFGVDTIEYFLDREFCLEYAEGIINYRGDKDEFLGKNQLEIAQECYAHAWLYHYTNITISFIDHGHQINAQAEKIGFVANDPNAWKYSIIWYLPIIWERWE